MKSSALFRRSLLTVAGTAALFGIALPAGAGSREHGEAEAALPIEGVVQILTFEGYQEIRRIKLDDGVYRVRARDAAGRPVELRVDPNTGAFTVRETSMQPNHERRADHAPAVPTMNMGAPPAGMPDHIQGQRVAALSGRVGHGRAPLFGMAAGSGDNPYAEPMWSSGRF